MCAKIEFTGKLTDTAMLLYTNSLIFYWIALVLLILTPITGLLFIHEHLENIVNRYSVLLVERLIKMFWG